MYLEYIRYRSAQLSKRLHLGERGNQTIETVLILALVAVLLTFGFKYMWGEKDEGLIPKLIKGVTDTFLSKVTGWLGGSSSGGAAPGQ